MSIPKTPIYQRDIAQARRVTTTIGFPDRSWGGREVVPLANKLTQLKSIEGCLNTASKDAVVGDASLGLRYISLGFQDIPHSPIQVPVAASAFISLPGVVGLGAGMASAYEHYKGWKRAGVIGDHEGQLLAALTGSESGVGALGSGFMLGDKSLMAVQEIAAALHHPVVFTGAAAVVQGIFSWGLSLSFGVSTLLKIVRYGGSLISFVQGREWRNELLASKDPIQALKSQLIDRTYQLDMTTEEEIQIALEAGARWLNRVESEGGIKIQDKEKAFEKLIMNNPQIIRDLIGDFGVPLTARGELIRFGKFMALQNICAKFEAECSRKLGPAVVDAMRSEDPEALKAALKARMLPELTLKIAAAVTGLAAIIILTFVMTGSAMGIAVILAGLISILMIYLYDWNALKTHLMEGDFKKRDRAFVYFTLALSVISFASVVGLTIVSGGSVPFIVSLILAGGWLAINSTSAYLLRRFDQRPWDVKKIIDRVTYLKFLETNPADRKRLNDKLQDKKWINMTLADLKAEESRKQKLLQHQLKWLKEQLRSR